MRDHNSRIQNNGRECPLFSFRLLVRAQASMKRKSCKNGRFIALQCTHSLNDQTLISIPHTVNYTFILPRSSASFNLALYLKSFHGVVGYQQGNVMYIVVWHSFYLISLRVKNFSLHLILKDLKESLSHDSSILPFRIVNRFVKRLLLILYFEVFVNFTFELRVLNCWLKCYCNFCVTFL